MGSSLGTFRRVLVGHSVLRRLAVARRFTSSHGSPAPARISSLSDWTMPTLTDALAALVDLAAPFEAPSVGGAG